MVRVSQISLTRVKGSNPETTILSIPAEVQQPGQAKLFTAPPHSKRGRAGRYSRGATSDFTVDIARGALVKRIF